VPSLMDTAKQRLTEVFTDETRNGIVVATMSAKNVNRADLIAWAMDDFAGDPDPSDSKPFRSLYVCSQPDVLDRVQKALQKVRRRNTSKRADDRVISAQASTLPPLREFTFLRLRTLLRLDDQFVPASLDLLVLDERQPGEMDMLAPFVLGVQPLLTIMVMTREPTAGHPWERFGEPLILRGPAQTPAAPAPAEPPA